MSPRTAPRPRSYPGRIQENSVSEHDETRDDYYQDERAERQSRNAGLFQRHPPSMRSDISDQYSHGSRLHSRYYERHQTAGGSTYHDDDRGAPSVRLEEDAGSISDKLLLAPRNLPSQTPRAAPSGNKPFKSFRDQPPPLRFNVDQRQVPMSKSLSKHVEREIILSPAHHKNVQKKNRFSDILPSRSKTFLKSTKQYRDERISPYSQGQGGGYF